MFRDDAIESVSESIRREIRILEAEYDSIENELINLDVDEDYDRIDFLQDELLSIENSITNLVDELRLLGESY